MMISVLLFGTFFLLSSDFSQNQRIVIEAENMQANINRVKDEVGGLDRSYQNFSQAINNAFSQMPLPHSLENNQADLLIGASTASLDPSKSLKSVHLGLKDAIAYLNEFSSMMKTRQAILDYIPNRWPVRGASFLSMEFGPNIHPIRGIWYLHKGVDIAGPYGLEVVTSAAGRVIKVGYQGNSEYGNYVDIEHRFGFFTKYGHMGAIFVVEGQDLPAGKAIGTLGSTGMSTGAHVHFEVLLGNQVLDPVSFLKISNTFSRWTGDRGLTSEEKSQVDKIPAKILGDRQESATFGVPEAGEVNQD